MYRNRIMFCLIVGLVLFSGFGFSGYAYPTQRPNSPANIISTIDTKGFEPRVGEVLSYELWVKSLIHGGRQTVKILSEDRDQDRDILHVQCAMTTIGLVWTLTKYAEVEDLEMDRDGLYPLSIRREIHNGDTISVDKVYFDYTKKVATRTYTGGDGKKETSEFNLPGIVQDAVSLQVFLRKGDFHQGMNKLYYYENGTVEETSYCVAEIKDPLELSCGIYSNYYQVNHSGGKITVFVARDTYHAPLIIRVLASFGKVEAKLSKIQ